MNNEVVTIRTINASRELVFAGWTNPDHLKNWWGPSGFTNTFHLFELKPGGKWNFVMHSPDGKNYLNESVFVNIEEPHLIVFDHVCEPFFRAHVQFEKLNETETKVIWTMIFREKETFEKLKAFVEEKNEENLDRLEVEIEKMK